MRYFLVAALDRDSNKRLESIQRPLHKRGRNYKKSPYICIPLDTIQDPDLKVLRTKLTEWLAPFRYFRVQAKGTYLNLPEDRITGLPVENFGYIRRIQRYLNDYLALSGFKVGPEKTPEDTFILSLSMDRIPREIDQAAPLFEGDDNTANFKVERIEVWKTLNAKRDSIALSIPLKNPNVI